MSLATGKSLDIDKIALVRFKVFPGRPAEDSWYSIKVMFSLKKPVLEFRPVQTGVPHYTCEI